MHDPSAGVTKERKLQVEVGMLKLLVKKIRLLVESFSFYIKNGSPPPFVKPLDLTSETFVKSTVGLIFVRKSSSCFNFYSIDIDYYCAQHMGASRCGHRAKGLITFKKQKRGQRPECWQLMTLNSSSAFHRPNKSGGPVN